MSLKAKTLSGLKWTFIETFFLKGSLFFVTILLARILGPKEFGLMGIISIFIALGITLVESGLSLSLIRTQKSNNEDFSTVFFTNLIFSFLVYLLFYSVAPFLSAFFHKTELINLIRVYCISFVLSAFSSIQIAILTKELKFRKLTILNLPGTLFGVVLSLFLAYRGTGVWSIVWMYLSSQLINVILLWIYSHWKPSFYFSLEKFKIHFNYGYKLMLAAVLETVFKNSYSIVIGKFFSIQALGFYDRAQNFNEYPVSVLTGIINKVSYPVLSVIQDDKERISNTYKSLIRIAFFLTAPLMLGFAAIAKPLFIFVLGKQWIEASLFFQILCLASIFYPIHAFNIIVLKVYGRTDLYLKLEIIKKAIIVLSITLSFQFGIYGLLWGSVVASLFAMIINTKYSGEMINYSLKEQLLDMMPVLFISLLMSLLIFISSSLLNGFNEIIQITMPLLIGLIFYSSINFFIKQKTFMFILQIIKNKKFQ